MTIQQGIANQEKIHYTLFRIDKEGNGHYEEDGELYTREEFNKKYPVPASYVFNNSPNSDGTKNWLITN